MEDEEEAIDTLQAIKKQTTATVLQSHVMMGTSGLIGIPLPVRAGIIGGSVVLGFAAGGFSLALVLALCLGALWRCGQVIESLMKLGQGDETMMEISSAIREGSTSFFKRVYGTIGKLGVPVALVLFGVYAMRSEGVQKEEISHLTTAFIVAITFLLGAGCSTAAGFIGLWVSVRVNVRVSAAAKALV